MRRPVAFLCLLSSTALIVLLSGCKARQPGSFETWAITGIKQHLTVGGTHDVNPIPATVENIHLGQENFSHYCFACHGLDGQKTGVPFADSMSPPIPLLNSKEVQQYTDGQLKSLIVNGISPSGMPAAHGILNDDEVWSIVLYLRHLPAKGSLGEPRAYSGDDGGASSTK